MPSPAIFKKLFILISSFIIMFALGGCTTGNFGRLQSDREIAQAFRELKILPDHKYYYRGTFSIPTVTTARELIFGGISCPPKHVKNCTANKAAIRL